MTNQHHLTPIIDGIENGRLSLKDVQAELERVREEETPMTFDTLEKPTIIPMNTNKQPDTVEEIVAELESTLDDRYTCTRVWEAWGVGTMSQDDFLPLGEDEDFIEELKNVFTKALQQAVKAYGGCTNCYGKGYSTCIATWKGRGYSKPAPRMRYCDCDRGNALEKEVELMKAQAEERGIEKVREVIASSRTEDEKYGIGVKEMNARAQIMVDLLELKPKE